MLDDKLRREIFAIVAKTFGVSTTYLTDLTNADEIDGWDSLAHATLLIRIEKSFDVNLEKTRANAAQNLGALVTLVREALK